MEPRPPAESQIQTRALETLLDVPLAVSVQVGGTRMCIQDILGLAQGSVIELTKLAGEPLDMYINGTLIARGECVVVNDKLGLRITEIIDRTARLNGLR